MDTYHFKNTYSPITFANFSSINPHTTWCEDSSWTQFTGRGSPTVGGRSSSDSTTQPSHDTFLVRGEDSSNVVGMLLLSSRNRMDLHTRPSSTDAPFKTSSLRLWSRVELNSFVFACSSALSLLLRTLSSD